MLLKGVLLKNAGQSNSHYYSSRRDAENVETDFAADFNRRILVAL